ncbi:MAG TPA: hypothetical protein HPP83_09870 [Candidatus Hydrogenedentes bacterium]|nr:hypothetical protein [Candidatus Hydrogenedentota bacterium]
MIPFASMRKTLTAAFLATLLVTSAIPLKSWADSGDEEDSSQATTNGCPYSEIELRQIARRYAPVVFQEIDCGTLTDAPRGREDFIAAVDFDGDLRANNNWENQPRFPLLPVLYFSVIETDTHFIISYSIYHPRDWSRAAASYTEHENDMENVQLVAEKSGADGAVCLLLTQSHIESAFTTTPAGRVRGREGIQVAPDLEFFDDTGRRVQAGTHVGIFIERKGHGIFSIGDERKLACSYQDGRLVELSKRRLASPVWEKFPIIQYVPSADGLDKREPRLCPSREEGQTIEPGVPYALESIYHRFWIGICAGELCGNGKLFDGSFAYRDELFDLKNIPRHFDGDNHSGPFKKDAGISPFAIGLSLADAQLGNFFFNPAWTYPRYFDFPGPWSTRYTYNPYLYGNERTTPPHQSSLGARVFKRLAILAALVLVLVCLSVTFRLKKGKHAHTRHP